MSMSDKLVQVTDQNFADVVLKSDKPVVVDFWAPWCRPCLMMAPIFEEFATEFDGKMVFAKLNTDDNANTAGRLGIQGIPTLIFFNKGREVNRVIGLESRDALRRHIQGALAAAV
jgi:thioredoxin 1